MASLNLLSSTDFPDSENTLGIAAKDSSTCYVAQVKTSKNLNVSEFSLSTQALTTLNCPDTGAKSPALASLDNGDLYIFYATSNSGDNHPLSAKKYSGGKWTEVDVSAIHTDHNAVVTKVNQNEICLVAKNNMHHFIVESWMNGQGTWTPDNTTTYWDKHGDGKLPWGYQTSSHDKHNGGETEQRHQIMTIQGGNPCTPRNPSLAVFNGKIFMAYKGERQTDDSDTGPLYIMNGTSAETWNNPTQITTKTSLFAPALVACGSKLICIYSNPEDHNYLNYKTSSDGTTWSGSARINTDALINHKATDPIAVQLDQNTIALSYVRDDPHSVKTPVLKVYSFTA